jgi:DNA-binding MarR family transcriptional regulator
MDGMTANAQPGLDFGILLAIGYQEFVRALRASMAASGFADLGRSDGYVLRALDGNPLTVSALAELLDITKQGAAQIVDDMGARGYVERRESTVDRRARPLYLTERGRRALAAARRFHRRYERELARQHGAEVVAGLRSVLTAIAGDSEGRPQAHV